MHYNFICGVRFHLLLEKITAANLLAQHDSNWLSQRSESQKPGVGVTRLKNKVFVELCSFWRVFEECLFSVHF